MLFSGVTWPKCASMMAAFLPDESRPWSVHVPKYNFPLALNSVSTLVASCCRSSSSPAGAATAASGARRRRSPDFIVGETCVPGGGVLSRALLGGGQQNTVRWERTEQRHSYGLARTEIERRAGTARSSLLPYWAAPYSYIPAHAPGPACGGPSFISLCRGRGALFSAGGDAQAFSRSCSSGLRVTLLHDGRGPRAVTRGTRQVRSARRQLVMASPTATAPFPAIRSQRSSVWGRRGGSSPPTALSLDGG